MSKINNKDAFQKEVDRIKKAIKRIEKRGFIVQDDIIPETPKRITQKALNNVKNITQKDIKSKARKVNYDTGEFETAKEVDKKSRSESAKKGWETRRKKQLPKISEPEEIYEISNLPTFSTIVISNFLAEVSHFPTVAYPIFKRWLDELISNYGEEDVAEMLEQSRQDGHFVTNKIAYDRERILSLMADMMDNLPDASEWFKKELTEAMEISEDWNDIT